VRSAALFDVDRTLVTVNTARLYVQWRLAEARLGQHKVSWLDYARVTKVLVQYALGTLEPEGAARHAFQTVRGYNEAQMRAECLAWYVRVVRPHISDRGRHEVAQKRSEGHVCAILSASTPYLTEPLAEDLGIEHVLCTRLEVDDGVFTGGWEAPLCYGTGKVERAQKWALDHGVDLARSTFYTDSISDLPMLEAVGAPRVVNPDPRLRLLAARRRYPVESWK
jgi:HAD superfamily hydrolase (TIGR01490 family)